MNLPHLPTEAVTSEPVRATLWDILQQTASFALTIASLAIITYPVARKLWRTHRKRQEREEAAHREERTRETADLVERLVSPMRDQLDAIHKTTHVNAHASETPTVLDRLHDLDSKVDRCIAISGAVAVNQATLSARLDDAQKYGREYVESVRDGLAEQGIDLPHYNQGGLDS